LEWLPPNTITTITRVLLKLMVLMYQLHTDPLIRASFQLKLPLLLLLLDNKPLRPLTQKQSHHHMLELLLKLTQKKLMSPELELIK
jgi:hypothetical protein